MQQVVRPGVPHPIDLAHFKLADKPSPPLRDDDKVLPAHSLQPEMLRSCLHQALTNCCLPAVLAGGPLLLRAGGEHQLKM